MTMRLSKQTATDLRQAFAGQDMQAIAANYKEKGLTFARFLWDAYHSLGHSVTRGIVARNNPTEEVIGGYFAHLNDSHIETMLKVAFSDCKF